MNFGRELIVCIQHRLPCSVSFGASLEVVVFRFERRASLHWFHGGSNSLWLANKVLNWGLALNEMKYVALDSSSNTTSEDGPTTSGKKWTCWLCMQNYQWRIIGDELLTKSPIEFKRNSLMCWVFLGNHSFTNLFLSFQSISLHVSSFAYHWCSLWWWQIGCSWQKIGETPYLEPWKRQVAMLTATWQSATTMWTWTQPPDMALLWATLPYVKTSTWKLLFLLWNWCIQKLCFIANGIETICTQSLLFHCKLFQKLCYQSKWHWNNLHSEAFIHSK